MTSTLPKHLRNLTAEDVKSSRKLGLQVINHYEAESLAYLRKEFPYQIPKGYLDWETLSAIINAGLSEPKQRMDDQGGDLVQLITRLWIGQRAPLYCVSNELLKAFQNTEVITHPPRYPRIHARGGIGAAIERGSTPPKLPHSLCVSQIS